MTTEESPLQPIPNISPNTTYNNEAEQHSIEWFRARHGYITGSQVYLILGKGRNGEEFSKTAKSYIYKVLAQRSMNSDIVNDDTQFQNYIKETTVTTRAMQFGIDTEPFARSLYEREKGLQSTPRGSVVHPTIPWFSSSPDGFFENENGCLEIKCPNQSTYELYRCEIFDNESLKTVEPQYYYQCQSHMMVTGADWCDFTAYCYYQSNPIHIVRILPDKDAFALIEDRVRKANELIDNILKN